MKELFHSHYPDFNVLDKWSSPDFDDQTREVIRKRLEAIPSIRFFNDHEAQTLSAISECIIPQPDRNESGKVPIVPWIDEILYEDTREGYRYEDLPTQRDAWRLGLQGIDETAQILFADKKFIELDAASRNNVLQQIEGGKPEGKTWEQLSAKRFFKSVILTTIVQIYYSHPFAWNEIGYSGPSSPRGHVRTWEGGIDPWDAQEKE